MSDLISREEVLDLLDTAFKSGAFDGRYAYENLIDAVQNLIHPLETDLVSRQAVIDTIETDCSWDMFNEWGSRTPIGESIIEAIKRVPSVESEKCEDCISRQAVIDRINKLIEVEKKQGTDDWGYGRERVNAYEAMLHFVKSEYLHPSVEPERKTGKWIKAIDPDVNAWTGGHTCSECGRACVQMSMNYCANCGAPMEVEK